MSPSKYLTPKQQTKKFKPYATEIGNVIFAWNRLQEELALLFWWFCERRTDEAMLAIWHSVHSDRYQRAMLRALIQAIDSRAFGNRPKAKEDILWLLGKADYYSNGRNDAVHAPYDFAKTSHEVQPSHALQNPKALNLKDKNLIDEFKNTHNTPILYAYLQAVYTTQLCFLMRHGPKDLNRYNATEVRTRDHLFRKKLPNHLSTGTNHLLSDFDILGRASTIGLSHDSYQVPETLTPLTIPKSSWF
jgi:hypothetical protein